LLIINQFIILKRIYYTTTYQGNFTNFENLINKSETFDYEKYCKCRDFWGEMHNLSNSGYYYHIDKEFIDSLKLKIESDQGKFHLYPFFGHNFMYSLEANLESIIYLTYNNDSIIKAEDANHIILFSAHYGWYENNSLYWEGNWFLNFTQIPFAHNISSTIMLNNSILVKMNLKYDYDYSFGDARDLIIDQFLCFNSNLQAIFVYLPVSVFNVT
jgi:hypothetical protein